MQRWKPAPRSMVLIYFGGFVLLWSGIAVGLLSGRELAAPGSVLPFRGGAMRRVSLVVANSPGGRPMLVGSAKRVVRQ